MAKTPTPKIILSEQQRRTLTSLQYPQSMLDDQRWLKVILAAHGRMAAGWHKRSDPTVFKTHAAYKRWVAERPEMA